MKRVTALALLCCLSLSVQAANGSESAAGLRDWAAGQRDAILQFWQNNSFDRLHGGFAGQILNDGTALLFTSKGLVLNTRILWTFSAAHRQTRNPDYLLTAERACKFLINHFRDPEHGGYYWMLDYTRAPQDTTKELYGLSFVIYSLAEYAQASGRQEPVDYAMQLFHKIESTARDRTHGGYFESFTRDWKPLEKSNLAYVPGGIKTMNTHLHMLEAYTNLYRVQRTPEVRDALQHLLDIYFDHILDPDTHTSRLFFDRQWRSLDNTISFGHDIEAAWLLCEAAELLGNQQQLERTRAEAVKMAQAVLDRGFDSDGGLLYEASPTEITNPRKDWWPQAETLVGMVNAWQISGERRFLDAAIACMRFTDKHLVDHENGGWYSSAAERHPAGERKGSPWKAPYHNGRACMELVHRLNQPR